VPTDKQRRGKAMLKKIGQTWVSPNFRSESGVTVYPGFVAILTNHGWLLLADVFVDDVNPGVEQFKFVKVEDVPIVDL
jgi:hypothetical protein